MPSWRQTPSGVEWEMVVVGDKERVCTCRKTNHGQIFALGTCAARKISQSPSPAVLSAPRCAVGQERRMRGRRRRRMTTKATETTISRRWSPSLDGRMCLPMKAKGTTTCRRWSPFLDGGTRLPTLPRLPTPPHLPRVAAPFAAAFTPAVHDDVLTLRACNFAWRCFCHAPRGKHVAEEHCLEYSGLRFVAALAGCWRDIGHKKVSFSFNIGQISMN
jgi:hypothetical protein